MKERWQKSRLKKNDALPNSKKRKLRKPHWPRKNRKGRKLKQRLRQNKKL